MGNVENFEVSGKAFGTLVAGVNRDQLSNATPCTEWNVRQLINHVVTGTQWFTTMLRHQPAPDRSIDHLGDDPAAAFDAAFAELLAAFAEPNALESTYEHRLGPVSGDRLAAMRANEYMVHGWDLAVSTGQPVGALPDEIVPDCLALYEELLGDRPREAGGAFGAPVEVADDAAPVDQLVAYFGRDPR